MNQQKSPIALVAAELPARTKTIYPEPFASRIVGREKRALGNPFGLTHFGVNLTRLAPGGMSALRHAHSHEDELVYILEGQPTLVTDAGETLLAPGMCAGFKAGTGDGHHLINRTARDVVMIEVGTRSAADGAEYPDDDLRALPDGQGGRKFVRKDGTPY